MTSGNQAMLALFLCGFMAFTANLAWQSGRTFQEIGQVKEPATCINLTLKSGGATVSAWGATIMDIGR